MTIVVTNDDGFESPGIHALAAMVRRLGHEPVVVAPAQDMSGASAAIGRIELDLPTPVRRVRLPAPADDVEAYAVDGPPGHGGAARRARRDRRARARLPLLRDQHRHQHRPLDPALRHGRGGAHRRDVRPVRSGREPGRLEADGLGVGVRLRRGGDGAARAGASGDRAQRQRAGAAARLGAAEAPLGRARPLRLVPGGGRRATRGGGAARVPGDGDGATSSIPTPTPRSWTPAPRPSPP